MSCPEELLDESKLAQEIGWRWFQEREEEAEEVGEPGRGGGQGACLGPPLAPRFPGGSQEEGGSRGQ